MASRCRPAMTNAHSIGLPPPQQGTSPLFTTLGFPECLSTAGDWHIRDLYQPGFGKMRLLDSGKGPGYFRPATRAENSGGPVKSGELNYLPLKGEGGGENLEGTRG